MGLTSGAIVEGAAPGHLVDEAGRGHPGPAKATLGSLLRLLPAILSGLITGAHFLRREGPWAASGFLLLVACLLLRRRWVLPAARWLLAAGALVWLDTALHLVRARQMMDAPWLRLVLILGGVAALHLAALLLLRGGALQARYAAGSESASGQAGAFLGTFGLLLIVRDRAGGDVLLAERFLPGAFWLSAVVLSLYAAFVAGWLQDERRIPVVRLRIWSLFSAVFFLQLILGMLGADRCLMSGQLHLPVPALIAAGPLYRGHGLFMPILFLATTVLAGPAWCSHLCYIGAWDNALSNARADALSRARRRFDPRWITLALTVAGAITLRLLGVSGGTATFLAAGFGLIGLGYMFLRSRKTGRMSHCTGYCPIGLVAVNLGKLSPFRMQIREDCRSCGLCLPTCRYGALSQENLRRGKPGPDCTLCGDCLASCRKGQILYKFPGLSPDGARRLFVAVVAALHAVFLGVARI